jgi:TolB protein
MRRGRAAIYVVIFLSVVSVTPVASTDYIWRLTDFPGDEFTPDWSPDGSKIAYSYQGDIWTIPAKGGTPIRITTSSSPEGDPDWSPDGAYIAFARIQGGLYSQILKIPSGGGDVTILTETRSYSPSWSPDGSWIAYSKETLGGVYYVYSIFKTTSDGGPGEQLTDLNYGDYCPTWSPDGSTIAFYSWRGGTYDVWSVPASGGTLTQKTDFPGDERYPDWSWATDRIAYTWSESDEGSKDIYVISSGGGEPDQITTDPADDTCPSWSPNGDMIVFSSDRDGDYDLWIVMEQYEIIEPASVGVIKSLFR